jgi:PAS domain S-box-containing protein
VFAGGGEMRARCRALDWAATPLGAVETWPQSLRAVAATVLGAGFPTVLLWGPDLVQLYNDRCVPLLGARHPAGLGQPTRACWPELWDVAAPTYERVKTGETVTFEDAHYPVRRPGPDGPAEDLYLTISYGPVPDEAGRVGGILVTLLDTTAQVLGRAAQTEHARLEAGIERARAETALVLDQVSDAYVLMDADFRITAVNQSAERVLARSRADLVGRVHWDAFPASVGAEPERQYRRVQAERVEAHFVHHYVGEGYDFYLEIDAYPVGEGGVAVFWRDVSERAVAAAAVEAARVEAEARAATLGAVIDSIPDALLVVGPEGLTLANQAALDQLGAPTVEALRAAPPAEALPLAERLLDPATGAPAPAAARPIERALLGERSHAHFLLRTLGAAGVNGARPVRAAAAPIVGLDGAILGAVAVLTDTTAQVTARREVERLLAESERARVDAEAARAAVERAAVALAESEQRFRLMADAVPQIVWTTDPEGRVEFFNRQWTAYTGAPYEPTTAAQVAAAFVHPDDGPATAAAFDEARRTGGVFAVEHRVRSAAGDYRWFLVRAEPYRDGTTGEILRWFGASVDIDDRKRAEAERERLLATAEAARAEADAARRAAETANRAKSEFLAVMSHELRTPLNAIGGYAELMEMGIRGPLTDQQLEDLGRIQRSQRHLLGLVNEVLNYAKLESGSVRYAMADVAVHEALTDAAGLVLPQARAKGLALRIRECRADLAVRADAEKLRQVLVNLLSNAIKFTDHGSAELSVTCDDARTVTIRVRDTGIGIPADKLGVIFEPFVQVRADLTRTAEGTGLGLAISRDLARGMGGDLTAESTPGEGSTFRLTLPLGNVTTP